MSADPTDFLFTGFAVLEKQFADVADPEVIEQREIAARLLSSIAAYKLDADTLKEFIQRVYNIFPYECRKDVADPKLMQKKIDAAQRDYDAFHVPLDAEQRHELFLDVKYLIDIRFFIIFRFQNVLVDSAGLIIFNNKK